jgi:hypothetical protein
VDVAALCPLPVGIVSWQSPGRVLTVIVKATFSLGMNGQVSLAPIQEPLSLDRPSGVGADDELEYASDFAPLKARADVIVVGHAYAGAPSQSIRARLVVDELDKSFYAVAAQPSSYIPLVEGYLRARPAPEAERVRVGPLAPWSATRAPFADSSLISAEGPPSRPLTSRFDFRFFNVAPPDQQLELLRATAKLTLEGLLPGNARASATLPGIVPKVFYLAEGIQLAGGRADPVALRCDTLWINTDRATCSVTWRGVLVEHEPRSHPPCLVVTMQVRGEEQPWRVLRTQLDGATHSRAVEAAQLRGPQASAQQPGRQRLDPTSPMSAKKFHEMSNLKLRGLEGDSEPPPSQTRSMIFADPTGRPEASALAERLHALREQKPPATPAKIEVPNPGRPLLDDATMDSPYANTVDEQTMESPYRLQGREPVDEGTNAPDTAQSTEVRPDAPAARVVRPKPSLDDDRPELPPPSERTVTTVHNPLLAAAAAAAKRDAQRAEAETPPPDAPPGAAKAPPPPPPVSVEAPTRPKPPRVPFPILDEPTLTMNDKIEIDPNTGEAVVITPERGREPRRG